MEGVLCQQLPKQLIASRPQQMRISFNIYNKNSNIDSRVNKFVGVNVYVTLELKKNK